LGKVILIVSSPGVFDNDSPVAFAVSLRAEPGCVWSAIVCRKFNEVWRASVFEKSLTGHFFLRKILGVKQI
jgi:hypothetical protein